MIMTQTFIATIAFSIGLLAFCAGSWLTIWATSSSHVTDTAAAKLAGYFVTILSLFALIFTSYHIALGVVSSQPRRYPVKMTKSNNHKLNNTTHKNADDNSATSQ